MAATPTTHRCGVVPPYLLHRLSQAGDTQVGAGVAEAARRTLQVQTALRGRRDTRAAMNPPGHHSGEPAGRAPGPSAGIVPDSMRRHADVHPLRAPSETPAAKADAVAAARAPGPHRSIHDAEHAEKLPGVLRRSEGEKAVADESVNEAYDGLGYTWSLYHDVYGRDSLDGAGLPLVASVHFAEKYDNAFWDGEQMVFGDGDGEIFGSFTDCVDVIGHELTHGFTQFTAGLVYVGQSGALNEHVSDVFGVLTLQHQLGQSAQEADWLIGKGLFLPSVKGVALRSMKAPGTAYDDPRLGKDPQPATMAGYVVLPHDDKHDNGGVHINSGIPNHAFYLAATTLGGHAWEQAGQVWFDVMTTPGLPKDSSFAVFAQACIAAATARYGAGSPPVEAVTKAWVEVGVLTADGKAAPMPTTPATGAQTEQVWGEAALR